MFSYLNCLLTYNSYLNTGDLTEKSKKHSKSKNRRGIDRDEHKTSKKTKKEDRHYFNKDWKNEYDLAGNKVRDETKALSAKAKMSKDSCEQDEFSLRKEKASRFDILEKTKRINDDDVAFHEKMKEHRAGIETLDLSGKKKTVKEWEDNRLSSMDHTSKGGDNENLNERLSKIKKSEARPEEVQDANALFSSAGRRQDNELVADNKFVTCKEGPSELWDNQPPRQVLNLAEPTRRDVACLQSSTVATSSSSKVSSSRRNKNSREAKGSPVESVSSSPLKNSNTDKISKARKTGKDGELNADSSILHTPMKYPTHEVGLLHTGQQAVGEAILRGSTNNSGMGRVDNQLYPGDKKILDMHGPTLQPDQQDCFNPRATADSTGHKSKNSAPSRQGRNGSSNLISEGNKQIEMSSRKEKLRPSIDNQDMQKSIGQDNHSHMKEGKSEVHTTRVKPGASKNHTQLRSNVENGDSASPIRRDGNMIAFALKEARDLKHKANHLKVGDTNCVKCCLRQHNCAVNFAWKYLMTIFPAGKRT